MLPWGAARSCFLRRARLVPVSAVAPLVCGIARPRWWIGIGGPVPAPNLPVWGGFLSGSLRMGDPPATTYARRDEEVPVTRLRAWWPAVAVENLP
jgi:hypothetical protein